MDTHGHTFNPDGLHDGSLCVGDIYCTVTYAEFKDQTARPGASGPLPRGWHRVRWTHNGRPQYVVTDNVASAALLEATLIGVVEQGSGAVADVAGQAWSDPDGGA